VVEKSTSGGKGASPAKVAATRTGAAKPSTKKAATPKVTTAKKAATPTPATTRTGGAKAPAKAKRPGAPGSGGTGIAALVLTPGAGAGRDHSALVAIEGTLAGVGIITERVDFPYRRAGRRSPDRPDVLIATVVDEATALASRVGVPLGRVALGGRSMGGRMCSMAVARGLPAAALVLVSYPLHPPGKPEQLRTDHFASLDVPCLFVSGTRDAFGTPEELEAATRLIPGPVTHVWLDGGDHGLRRKDEEVATAVREWLAVPGGQARPVTRRGAQSST
jgi:predicted alpha/beta-hydrolase family hydrolase